MFKFKLNKKYDELKNELMESINFLKKENNRLENQINELKLKFEYIEIEEKINLEYGYDIFDIYRNLYFIDKNCNKIKLYSYYNITIKLKKYFIKKINNDMIIGVQFNRENNEKKEELKEYFIFNETDKTVNKINAELITEMSKNDINYDWIKYKGEE